MKEYMNLSIEEIHEALTTGKVTSKELIQESLKRSHDLQEKCNAFVTIIDDAKEVEVTDNLLSGIPYGIKDNYSTKGILSTGSSNTLKDYIPFFTATAIENLERVGAVAVNKTVLDEFGMGGTGTTGHTGIVRNPWDTTRMCAGSSSGSAAAVAAGVAQMHSTSAMVGSGSALPSAASTGYVSADDNLNSYSPRGPQRAAATEDDEEDTPPADPPGPNENPLGDAVPCLLLLAAAYALRVARKRHQTTNSTN